MSAKKGITSTSTTSKGKKGGRIGASSRRSHLEKPVELLFERKFRERFRIPNGISVHLVDEDPTSIEKKAPNAIFFSKE